MCGRRMKRRLTGRTRGARRGRLHVVAVLVHGLARHAGGDAAGCLPALGGSGWAVGSPSTATVARVAEASGRGGGAPSPTMPRPSAQREERAGERASRRCARARRPSRPARAARGRSAGCRGSRAGARRRRAASWPARPRARSTGMSIAVTVEHLGALQHRVDDRRSRAGRRSGRRATSPSQAFSSQPSGGRSARMPAVDERLRARARRPRA